MENVDTKPETLRIGLALSGGGIRAAVFHLGLLKRLAKAGLLEQVSQISSVSGGSLIVGAVFTHSNMRWPTSDQFLNDVYPKLRALLTSRDLFSFKALGLVGTLIQMLRIVFDRATVLSWLIEKQWKIEGSLSDLPDSPVWHINTTCFETGKNWRFTKGEMGDWVFGRHYSPKVKLSQAMTASAAVPYAIGALKLQIPAGGWWETDPVTRSPREVKSPLYSSVRLWDGGAYENLGLEAIFKPGETLRGCDFLICSDASGPLKAPAKFPFLQLLKGSLMAPRLFDIASDQIRSLRSRMLFNAIKNDQLPAILVKMGVSERKLRLDLGAKSEGAFSENPLSKYLSDQDAAKSFGYPTDLKRISESDFKMIARHGFEICDGTMGAYSSYILEGRILWH